MDIRERMEAGLLYTDEDRGLTAERGRCQELLYDYNHTRPSEGARRRELLTQLLGSCGEHIWIEPPFKMAYGYRTHIGDYFYANFNLVIVDDIDVYIGDHVMIAPNVVVTATGHPIHPDVRRDGRQFSLPVHIEDDVWIGAGAIILPGVTIGRNSVIGAGSVVTRDIPPNVVAVGTPCRVLREITDRDREFYCGDRPVSPF